MDEVKRARRRKPPEPYWSAAKRQYIFVPHTRPGEKRTQVRGPKVKSAENLSRFKEEIARKFAAPKWRNGREPLNTFVTAFVERPGKKGGTQLMYASFAKKLAAGIGVVPLGDISHDDIIRTLAAEAHHGRTALGLYRMLTKIFKTEVAKGTITVNPMNAVDPPAYRRKKQRRYFTLYELSILKRVGKGNRLEAMLHLLIDRGMRPGEAYGLYPSDVDKAELHINRSLTLGVDYKPKEGPPKTEDSERDIPLTPRHIALLRERMKARLAEGAPYPYLFTSERGKPIEHCNLVKNWWKPLLDLAEAEAHKEDPTYAFPRLGMYCLRQTASANAKLAGADQGAARKMLGHSAATSLKYYNEIPDDLRRATVAKIDAFLATEF